MIPDELKTAMFPNDHPKEEILRSLEAIRKALRAIEVELGVEPYAEEDSRLRLAAEARLKEREADRAAQDERNEELLRTPLPPLEEMRKMKRAKGIAVEETESETMARLRARAAELRRNK